MWLLARIEYSVCLNWEPNDDHLVDQNLVWSLQRMISLRSKIKVTSNKTLLSDEVNEERHDKKSGL